MPERRSLSGGAFPILKAIIRNAPAVSSKVEEKGSPATSFITEPVLERNGRRVDAQTWTVIGE